MTLFHVKLTIHYFQVFFFSLNRTIYYYTVISRNLSKQCVNTFEFTVIDNNDIRKIKAAKTPTD